MTKPIPGKLKSNCPEFPSKCDICDRQRSQGNHKRCSKIRQQLHADMVRDEEADRELMFDKKEVDDDPPILVPPTDLPAE